VSACGVDPGDRRRDRAAPHGGYAAAVEHRVALEAGRIDCPPATRGLAPRPWTGCSDADGYCGGADDSLRGRKSADHRFGRRAFRRRVGVLEARPTYHDGEYVAPLDLADRCLPGARFGNSWSGESMAPGMVIAPCARRPTVRRTEAIDGSPRDEASHPTARKP